MVGAKRALKPQQVWAIRFWLDHQQRPRDRAMFDLAIDSKLRGCDVVKIKLGDLVVGGRVRIDGGEFVDFDLNELIVRHSARASELHARF